MNEFELLIGAAAKSVRKTEELLTGPHYLEGLPAAVAAWYSLLLLRGGLLSDFQVRSGFLS